LYAQALVPGSIANIFTNLFSQAAHPLFTKE
jgi:hypothetical protein